MDTTKIPVQKPITSITSTSKVPVINQNADVINKIVIYGLAVTAGFALKTVVQSFVFDVLEPLCYSLFSFTKYTSKLVNKKLNHRFLCHFFEDFLILYAIC